MDETEFLTSMPLEQIGVILLLLRGSMAERDHLDMDIRLYILAF